MHGWGDFCDYFGSSDSTDTRDLQALAVRYGQIQAT